MDVNVSYTTTPAAVIAEIGFNASAPSSGFRNRYYGSAPIAIGTSAKNTVLGNNAGRSLSINGRNVFLGESAGTVTTSALNCVLVGESTSCSATASNQIGIGRGVATSVDNTCVIGNDDLVIILPSTAASCNLGSDASPFQGLYLKPYLLAGLPAVGSGGGIIYVSDATGASVTGSQCFSNGTSWIDVTTHVGVV